MNLMSPLSGCPISLNPTKPIVCANIPRGQLGTNVNNIWLQTPPHRPRRYPTPLANILHFWRVFPGCLFMLCFLPMLLPVSIQGLYVGLWPHGGEAEGGKLQLNGSPEAGKIMRKRWITSPKDVNLALQDKTGPSGYQNHLRKRTSCLNLTNTTLEDKRQDNLYTPHNLMKKMWNRYIFPWIVFWIDTEFLISSRGTASRSCKLASTISDYKYIYF